MRALLPICAAALLLAGCQTPAPRITTQPVELPMPSTRALPMPSVSRSEWACPPDVHAAHPDLYCVTHETYRKLAVRAQSRRTFGHECAAIIRANNKAAIDWPQFEKDAAQAAAQAAAQTDAEPLGEPNGHH